MGEVYAARDTRLFGRPVAIKILSERLLKTDIALSRFRLEVEVAAKLAHPNIVTIFGQGEFESRPYFVMEYLEGFDLDHLIRNPGLRSFADKLRIAYQVCEGLDYAHGQGVVHRDLKPANIMITERGGRDEAKLVDFGIVHVDESGLTQDGAQPGTFNYMAPEQLAPDGLVVAPSLDLFSLGIVLFKLFTGKHPFGGTTDVVTANRILSGDREPLGELIPPEARDLEGILTRLLAHDPADRPGRAAEVSVILQSVLLPLQGSETDPSGERRAATPAEVTVDRQVQRAVSDLELGRLDDARRQLVEALKRDATNPRAMQMLDRILLINEQKISYRPYFRALRQARESLKVGDLGAAREHCRRAAEIWNDDFEWRDLEREIESSTPPPTGELPPTRTSTEPPTATAEGKAMLEPAPAPAEEHEAPAPPRRRKTKTRREPTSPTRRPSAFAVTALAVAAVLVLGLVWVVLPDRAESKPVAPERVASTPSASRPARVAPEVGPVPQTVAEAAAQPQTETEPRTDAPEPPVAELPRGTEPVAAVTGSEAAEAPARRAGFLSVRTLPAAKAEVFVDNRYAGYAPLSEYRLDEGSHRLRVEAAGFEPFLDDVRIRHGQTRSLTAELTALPETTAPREPAVAGDTAAPVQPTEPRTQTPQAAQVDLEGLWSRAAAQKDAEEFFALRATLDEILAVDPDYEQAPKWMRKIDGWIEDQTDHFQDLLEEMLEDLAAYVEDRELDNIEEMWNGKLDGPSREYFARLFQDNEGPVRLEVGDLRVTAHDRSADFSVPVVLRAKPRKGRGVAYEEVGNFEWRGRAEQIDDELFFAGPFR